MFNPLLHIRECFHLHFLQQLASRLASRPYAVKGGICLRFFHGSPRFSEDIDLDISAVPVPTLSNAVDGILKSASLAGALLADGVRKIEFSKPKQTETTQRWKVTLHTNSPLTTKIEFSRRESQIRAASSMPDAAVLKNCHTAVFAARHYDANSMAIQKIHALASPQRNAARDLFDLHHLIRQTKVKILDIAVKLPHKTLESAAETASSFSHRQFKEEVLPFLPESLHEHYAEEAAFKKMREETVDSLLEILS